MVSGETNRMRLAGLTVIRERCYSDGPLRPLRAFIARTSAFAKTVGAKENAPLLGVLAAALSMRMPGLTWGLPASDGWDDDGVAPRDFLPGVLETYWPGHHYTYPPLHLLLLTVLTSPVWVPVLARVHSRAAGDVIATFIRVPTMTVLAVTSRAVTIALSVGLLATLAALGRELGGRRPTGVWVAAACAANAAFTYYSETTNLDVPYLFWAALAMGSLVRALARNEPRVLDRVGVFAALALATKDQAYALFLLGLPLTVLAWMLVGRSARPRLGIVVVAVARCSAIASALVLVLDGAVVNPSGFLDRIRFLAGSASQDHAAYASDAAGRMVLLRDLGAAVLRHCPWPFVVLGAVGLVAMARSPSAPRRAAGLVPFLLALSFTFAFNIAARRTDDRFVLPQSLVVGIYAGLGLDALHRAAATWAASRSFRAVAVSVSFWAVVAASFAVALFHCAAVDAAMLLDPRYDAAAWMHDHVRPGDRVEVYDNDVHLVRFPPGFEVERVDQTPVEGRNPMPDVVEVRDRFANVAARSPRFVVVSDFWASKYLFDPDDVRRGGRILTAEQRRIEADRDARTYFANLRDGRLGYRWVHASRWSSRIWPRVPIHGTLTGEVWIFERETPRP